MWKTVNDGTITAANETCATPPSPAAAAALALALALIAAAAASLFSRPPPRDRRPEP